MPERPVVLVGLMGSGKSTIGRLIADRIGWDFVDSDLSIETSTGRTVKQILADDGLDELRRHEAAALFDALDHNRRCVIAAAGGIVLDPAHCEHLKASDAEVVWLQADPALIAERTVQGEHRPWLEHDPVGTMQEMSEKREELYRDVSNMVVTVAGLTPDEIADRILT